MKTKGIKLIVSALLLANAFNGIARENVGGTGSTGNHNQSGNHNKSVNEQCSPASAQIDLDINNVRAKILNGGDMWWDIFGTQTAAYQVPRSPGTTNYYPSSQFASSVWVGGYDAGGQLKEAAQTYRQSGNDYWPGPLLQDATTSSTQCLAYDKFWKVDKADVIAYYNWATHPTPGEQNPLTTAGVISGIPKLSNAMDQINSWPAFGPYGEPLAPFYSVLGDYTVYNPNQGDVPDFDVTGTLGCNAQLFGDQSIFWVFNDKGNVHSETQAQAIGLEIQAQAFAFQSTNDLNNATFCKYKIINKSSFKLDSTFFGLWDDMDLGWYDDDYVGCDVGLGLGIGYNGLAVDGTGQLNSYGANPPAVGVDFFLGPIPDSVANPLPAAAVPPSYVGYGTGQQWKEHIGMSRFMYFNNNANPVNGNPGVSQGGSSDDYYQYLSGAWKNGTPQTYGGDGTSSGGVPCRYMFPGSSDPLGYGTNMVPQAPWDEVSSGNVPGDRRFLISAGPFTLQAGAVNYIIIGVPWARTSQGGNLASVALLKGADILAQNLFDNCFSNLQGPTAPSLTIQELNNQLILYWSNPRGSNNNPKDSNGIYHDEGYSESYDKSSSSDSLYRFQGYIVYQLLDNSVSQTDLYNPDKARIVFQCDKKDGVAQIVNYTNDVSLSALVPQEMVAGADAGVVHSCTVTTDLFATGNSQLINHKPYYFAIVAYGYSPTQNPVNLNILTNYSPFISGVYQSDASFVHTAFPHNPTPEAGGTVSQCAYGSGPRLTRIEGQGNGGNVLDFTNSTISDILNPTNNSRVLNPQYNYASGPVQIQVVDPLNVPSNNFRLIIYPKTTGSGSNAATGITTNSTWDLINLDTHDTVHSDKNIALANQQIICGQTEDSVNSSITLLPKWGLSVNTVFTYDPGNASAVNNSFLQATMTFDDPTKQWLTGVADADGTDPNTDFIDSYHNWIRSGTYMHPSGGTLGYDDWTQTGTDPKQYYEKVLGGTWAPYRLCAEDIPSASVNYYGGPQWDDPANSYSRNSLSNVSSVDVVITNNKDNWTRCPVLEMGENDTLSVGGAKKLSKRKSKSVDKNGLNNTQAGFNSTDGNLTDTAGMGWFPGYAINLETGERLNMAFGEDSWLKLDNGSDMMWNPTSTDLSLTNGTPLFGGKHYIYIFGHNGDIKTVATTVPPFNHLPIGSSENIPFYDQGRVLDTLFNASVQYSPYPDVFKEHVFIDAMWVNIPLLAIGHSLLETDVKIRLRVAKSYQKGYATVGNSSNPVVDTSTSPVNKNFAVYDFNTSDIGTITNSWTAAKNALSLINVVPNPYYAYSGYELSTASTAVKITNLPLKCTINIYTLNGTLVRTFNVAQSADAINTMGDEVTSVTWDLQNSVKVPIASGLYLIDIQVPNVGEVTLKWFGVLRPLDLDTY